MRNNLDIAGFWEDLWQTLCIGSVPWEECSVLRKAYMVGVLLSMIALLPMPYGYYFGMRAFFCIVLYFHWKEIKKLNSDAWLYSIYFLFVLYNPIFPISFGEIEIWIAINLATLFYLYHARMRIEATLTSND